jgi:hypothetical protein
MTPGEFIARWQASKKDETRDIQTHFNDLYRLLEIDDPATDVPQREWFTFEKSRRKPPEARAGPMSGSGAATGRSGRFLAYWTFRVRLHYSIQQYGNHDEGT